MTEPGEWQIVSYVTDTGDSPQEPLVRHLEGSIWELRRASNTNIYRPLYSFVPGRRILLLHGFQKRTRKTPGREIEVAQRRLADLLHRQGGKRTS